MTLPAAIADPPAIRRRKVVVLGSTGSIGTNTLDVVGRLPELFEVVGLSARSRAADLAAQAERFRPQWVALTGESGEKPTLPAGTEFLTDAEAVARRVQAADVDVVVSAVVGAAGLLGTWAALEAGKTVALANKETLVLAGGPVMDLVRARGGRLLPVDSEHSAIFQAIADRPAGVERVVLTGSGGPFRGRTRDQLRAVTVEEALNHPTWRMGPKITVDSATLMNKALEVIEARWLFALAPDRIDVVIHPESMVHSFVEFVDGSVLAQISPPDMRLPIQYALTYPERLPCPARRVNWRELSSFRFEAPDRETFPALDLGYEVARRGGTAGAVLNAANEVAVEAFLARQIPFLDIPRASRAVLDAHAFDPRPTLDGLLAADRWARQEVRRWIRPNP
ncbi:MAG TPA: 1-deoxy-D-xylulose-5-phosphate reductoisomerase [Gemmataceae bacterium]|nr:1-deoxy-D-xylulose-5-phosphate reductoisomerase [Gemmataceae bacterium]